MKLFKKYDWLIEFISAALLLAAGVVVIFVDAVILYITGALFVIMGIFRIVPLLKSTKDKLMKYLLLVEIILEVVAGCYLFYMGTQNETVGKGYGYIVGSVFYIHGLTHFVATSLRNEPNTTLNFFVNIILLTLGVFIISYGKIDANLMRYIIAGLLVVCILFLCFRGARHYGNYRGELVAKNETKLLAKKLKEEKKQEKKNRKSKNEELPTSDEINININDVDKPSDSINA